MSPLRGDTGDLVWINACFTSHRVGIASGSDNQNHKAHDYLLEKAF